MSTSTIIAGRYELTERIGSGGSGSVWRAHDRELERDVAIKRVPIPGDLGDRERERARERVAREARAAARLRHPGVTTVYDILTEDEHVAIVMTFVDAPNLRQLVEREGGALSDDRAAAIGAAILDVLTSAHQAGVVHRDVKPSNVLVTSRGEVKLTDFGIASLADETRLTRTGHAVGSPSYFAPEQARGEEPTPAVDLWGLGATLYFAVTGASPFDRGQAVSSMHAVLHDEPRAPDRDTALWPLIRGLLHKDPAQRPDAEEIRAYLDDPRAAATREQTSTQRLPGGAAAAAGAAGGAAGAAVADDPTEVVPDRREAMDQRKRTERPDAASRGDAPPPRPDRDTEDGSERRIPIAIGIFLLVAAIGGTVWFGLGADEGVVDLEGGAGEAQDAQPAEDPDTDPPERAQQDEQQPEDAGPPRQTEPERTEQPSPDETQEAQEQARAVPEGWEVYDGPTYDVAAPAGWVVRDNGGTVDLVDPETGDYLRLDFTDQPKDDPVADWEQQSEAFAQRHEDYEEIRIEPADPDVPGVEDAAIWEYTYTEDGQRFHAVNLGMTTGECGYALNYQTDAETWGQLSGRFDDFIASFQPQGC